MADTFGTVLIDGDQMVYACGFASEGEPISHTLRLVKNKMEQILLDCGTMSYELYIGGVGNYRDTVDPEYKATRTARKPEAYNDIRDYLIKNWGARVCNGYEADDAVGAKLGDWYARGEGHNEEDRTFIVSSPDKDLNTVPGWHYNPQSRVKLFINQKQATRFLAFQMLAGDRVDNISGLPDLGKMTRKKYGLRKGKGCGEVSAKKIIKNDELIPSGAWMRVIDAYIDWGIDKGLLSGEIAEYCQQQYQLLWISSLLEGDEPARPEEFPTLDFIEERFDIVTNDRRIYLGE